MANHIQIGDLTPRKQYTADGVQTNYTYPFPIFTDADLEVYLGEVLQGSGFTVSGAGVDIGGNVMFDIAPANGVVVTLRRRLTVARQSDFQESGAFRAKVINDELDFIVAAVQETQDTMIRSIRLADFDGAANMVLPGSSDRTNKMLVFDTAGNLALSTMTIADMENGVSGPAGPVGPQGLHGLNGTDGYFSGTEAIVTPATDDLLAVKDTSDHSNPKFALLQDVIDLAGSASSDALEHLETRQALTTIRMIINEGFSIMQLGEGFGDVYEDATGLTSQDGIVSLGRVSLSGVKTTFNCTGADQQYVVPAGVTSVEVKCWGAGSGQGTANYSGACGGFAKATIPVTPGETLNVMVGQSGAVVPNTGGISYSAGGRSGFYRGTMGANDQANALVIAGGAGGALIDPLQETSSGGGGLVGQDGTNGTPGGTQVAPGGNGVGSTGGDSGGIQYRGSLAYGGGGIGGHTVGLGNMYGGGGGYYGGGGSQNVAGHSGAGGSSYVPAGGITEAGLGSVNPGGVTDTDYIEPIGRAGVGGAGHDGMLVVIQFNPTLTFESVSVTANVQPTKGRLVIVYEDVNGDADLATDVLLDMSRDGGVTWVAGVATPEGGYDATREVMSATFDFTGVASGISMRYRVRTLNSVNLAFDGTWAQWG